MIKHIGMGLSVVEPKKINTLSTNTAQTKRNEVLVCNQNAALPKTDKGIRKKKNQGTKNPKHCALYNPLFAAIASLSHLIPSHSTPGAVKMNSFCYRSDSAIASATASALDGVEHPARPVLEEVGNVAQSVAVGEEVPASCAVAVVVEPRAEDQVCGNAKEDAGGGERSR